MTPLQQIMLQGQRIPTVEADGGDAGILNQAQPQPALAQAQPQPEPQGWYEMKPGTAGDWGNALSAIGRGFAIAGSPVPAQTFHEFVRSDREAQEMRKPRVTPLANGAFSQVTFPDGSTKIIRNDDVASFLMDQTDLKGQQKMLQLLFGKKLEADLAGVKSDIKAGDEARPLLNQTQAMFDGWKQAKTVVSNQAQNSPTMSKLQGMFPGIAGFFGGDEVAANKFLQGLTVDETLLKTANTKGAISNEEMALFKSPQPSLSDDREKVWKPWIEQRLPVIEKLMRFQQETVDRAANPASKITGGAPAPRAFTVPGLSEGASRYFSK